MPTIEESLRKKQSIFLNVSSKEQLETIYRFAQKFTTVGILQFDFFWILCCLHGIITVMKDKNSSVAGEYFSYFVPCVLMAIATQSASIIDKVFIGNFVNPVEMGAVNACVPITQFVYTLSVLIGVGASAVISVLKGQKKEEDCNRVLGAAVLWSIFFGLFFLIFLIVCSDFVLTFLLKDKSIQELAKAYYLIFIFMVPFRLVSSVVQNISRADGFPKIGSVAVIVSNICNVFFNWLFMGPMEMGVRGAAYGTLICFFVECVINLSYFLCKGRTFKLWFKGALAKTGSIFSMGLSACIGTGLIAFKLVILNNLAEKLNGETGLVVMAVCLSCLSLASMFSAGANNAMLPLAGKYFGSKDMENFKCVIKFSAITLFLFTTVVVILLEFFAGTFTHLHGVQNEVEVYLCVQSIRIYAVSLYGMCFTFFMIYLLPVIGKKLISTMMSICEGFAFIVPLCFVFSSFMGLKGIWVAFIVTEILTVGVYFAGNKISKKN